MKTVINSIKYALKGNTLIILATWLVSILNDLYPLLFSVIWAYLIDTAIKGIETNNLSFQVLLLPFLLYAGLEIVKAIFNRTKDYLENRVFDVLESKVYSDVITKYSSLDIQSLEDPEVNRLFQIIRSSYDWRIRTFVFSIGDLLSALIIISISSSILFKISPLILGIIIASAIPSLIINAKFGSIGWGIWREDADKQRKFNLTKDFLLDKNNLVEAQINNVIPYLINIIKGILDNYHRKRIPHLKKRAVYMFITDILRIAGSIYSVYLLISGTLNGTISIGELLLASSIFVSISTSLASLLSEITYLFNATLYMQDFLKFMNLEPKMKSGPTILTKLEKPPLIEFQNVSFKYPNTERFILKDINIEIKPGEKIALVGDNGAGKTTLIKLLSRFYDTSGGDILINNQKLSDIDTESWNNNLGLLTQYFNRYPAFSLEDNIYMGDVTKEKNIEKIREAAEKAQVTSFMKDYPNGYKQLLSIQFDDGIDPSWGQWQRIGIARTLFRNSQIFILDEPTSAVDAQAEHDIFENLNQQTQGKTVIYVSHRYSTVRNADKILVLDGGIIAEEGTHKELMKLNGIYAKNFNLQASGYN